MKDLQQLASIARRALELLQQFLALSPQERIENREQYLAEFDALKNEFEKRREWIQQKD